MSGGICPGEMTGSPPPGQTGRRFLPVRFIVCYQTFEHDVLNTNEAMLMQTETSAWSTEQQHETGKFGGQDSRGQSSRFRSAKDRFGGLAEAYRPPWSSSFLG